MCTDPIIELLGVTKVYRHETALHPTDLCVKGGSVHALVGMNGAGKTTLMRLVLGISTPTAGRVRVYGTDIANMPSTKWARVGHLIETPLAYAELTVKQNLYIAGRLAGLNDGAANASARTMVEELALTQWWKRRVSTLSLGNRQRLGIAVALIADPELLILDEPTNALDPAGVLLVRQLLVDRVKHANLTVLVSSHHLDEVARIADYITVLNAGRVIGSLAPDAVDLERRFFELVRQDAEAT